MRGSLELWMQFHGKELQSYGVPVCKTLILEANGLITNPWRAQNRKLYDSYFLVLLNSYIV